MAAVAAMRMRRDGPAAGVSVPQSKSAGMRTLVPGTLTSRGVGSASSDRGPSPPAMPHQSSSASMPGVSSAPVRAVIPAGGPGMASPPAMPHQSSSASVSSPA